MLPFLNCCECELWMCNPGSLKIRAYGKILIRYSAKNYVAAQVQCCTRWAMEQVYYIWKAMHWAGYVMRTSRMYLFTNSALWWKGFKGQSFVQGTVRKQVFYFFIGNLLTIICVQRNQSCCHFTVHVTKLRPLWSHKLPKFNLWDIKMYLGAFVRVKIIVLQPFFCIHSWILKLCNLI